MGKTRRHTHKKSKAHRHTKKCIGRKHRNHTKKMSGGGIRSFFRKRGERKAEEKKRKAEIKKAAEAKGQLNYEVEFPERARSSPHKYNVLVRPEEAIYASIKSRRVSDPKYANASIRSGSYANGSPKLQAKPASYAKARNYGNVNNEDIYAVVNKNPGQRTRSRILVKGASPSNTILESDL
jgi:hypothetical protein